MRFTEVDGSALGPADVWRQDRSAGLVLLPLSGVVTGLLAVLTVGLVPGFKSGLAFWLTSRFPIVCAVVLLVALGWGIGAVSVAKRVGAAASSPGAAATETALTVAQLAIRHKIPLRLIVFLEDARNRHLLRTVGPVYQFRHAKLQDRLAQPNPETSPCTERARHQ